MRVTHGTLKQAVTDYLGHAAEVECVADPVVPGTFAVQAQWKDEWDGRVRTAQFLIVGVPLQQVTEDDLSEVEFTSWPPVSH